MLLSEELVGAEGWEPALQQCCEGQSHPAPLVPSYPCVPALTVVPLVHTQRC